jgi:hypothetical protein
VLHRAVRPAGVGLAPSPATGTFNALGPGYIRISQNPATGSAGTCYGDSGGPQFLDGVLVSITVTGDVLCKSTNVVQRLDTKLAQ